MLTLRTKRIETGTCKEMINQTLFTVVSFFSGTCRRAEYQYIKKKKGGFKPPGIQIIQVFLGLYHTNDQGFGQNLDT